MFNFVIFLLKKYLEKESIHMGGGAVVVVVVHREREWGGKESQAGLMLSPRSLTRS